MGQYLLHNARVNRNQSKGPTKTLFSCPRGGKKSAIRFLNLSKPRGALLLMLFFLSVPHCLILPRSGIPLLYRSEASSSSWRASLDITVECLLFPSLFPFSLHTLAYTRQRKNLGTSWDFFPASKRSSWGHQVSVDDPRISADIYGRCPANVEVRILSYFPSTLAIRTFRNS